MANLGRVGPGEQVEQPFRSCQGDREGMGTSGGELVEPPKGLEGSVGGKVPCSVSISHPILTGRRRLAYKT